jgi:hypothetical protein
MKMTLTRWKLLAGVFGLSVCGLAALAEPACRTIGYAHRQNPDDTPAPLPKTGSKPTPAPPIDVPLPKLEVATPTSNALPLPSLGDAPVPVQAPVGQPLSIPTVVVALPGGVAKAEVEPATKLPTIPRSLPANEFPGGLDQKSFTTMSQEYFLRVPQQPTSEYKQQLELPQTAIKSGAVPLKKESDDKTLPLTPPEALKTPVLPDDVGKATSDMSIKTLPIIGEPNPKEPVAAKPVQVPPTPRDSEVLPVPLPTPQPLVAPTLIEPNAKLVTPALPLPALQAPATVALPTPPEPNLPNPPMISVKAETPAKQLTPRAVETTEIVPVTPIATANIPETAPVPTSSSSTVTQQDRKLKVQVHLGSGKPWFEVRDGEELVLKVVCDTIEVKAPGENGDAASVLKANGGVVFRTLGTNGTCEELRIQPGTGDVVVSGRVAVTSNWGKSETTASSEKMTFKLGGQVVGMSK